MAPKHMPDEVNSMSYNNPGSDAYAARFLVGHRSRRSPRILAAITLLFAVSLLGCSWQKNASPTAYEQAAIASDLPPGESAGVDYDPWEPFNERTFSFNFNILDHYGLKPVAQLWAHVPLQVRNSIGNGFYNLAMPRRFLNKVLQGRFPAAGEELASFVINTTVGVAGLFDVASKLGLKKSDADTGQTFGVYGVKSGPYLVLPVLQPLTVRDAVGYAADSFEDPLSLFLTPILADIGRSAAYTINERAAHMTEFDDVEDTSLDLYAAVRNGYLQRRHEFIEDGIRDRDRSWELISRPRDERTQDSNGLSF
jgi:phospholipid-binding lipoprotein MlaA